MELVYLWVEDYKNIKKQGFNFSPRFDCEFHDEYEKYTDENGKEKERLKDNCKLDIQPKEHIENFFGENINVTAIVGKNGSGKSNILELFFYASAKGIAHKEEKYFIVYFNNQQQKFLIGKSYSFKENILFKENCFNMPCHDFDDMVKFHHSIYFNNFYRNPPLNYILPPKSPRRDDISLMGQITENKGNITRYYLNNIKKAIELLKIGTIKLPNDFSKIESIELIFMGKSQHDSDLDKNLVRIRFKELFKNLSENDLHKKHIKKKIKFFDNIKPKKFKKVLKEKVEEFLELFKYEYSFEEFPFELLELYLGLLDCTVESFIDFDWKPYLSSGEETLLFQFANFYSVMKENKYEDEQPYCLYIDEGESSLHPNWQKKYVSYIVQFLKDNFPNKKIHIILTTHSPFLLSDIPKDNIIFLDKEKNGNCKVLTHNEVLQKKQTFGANIHTLLSDSFFMENGLMGEFAKGKIRTIKVAHRYILHRHKRKTLFTQSSKRSRRLLVKILPKFWQIQKIIGEPFLQKIVKNQLEEIELILLGRDEAIDNEIARLQALKVSSKNA